MKGKIFKLVILLLVILGINSCGGVHSDYRYIENQSNIEKLNDSVVALILPIRTVREEMGLTLATADTVNTIGREHRPYCAGFFISRTEVLTAAHCVQRVKVVTTLLGNVIILLKEDPTGDLKKVSTYSNYVAGRGRIIVYRTFEVVRYNNIQDLALLRLARGEMRPVHYSVLEIGPEPRSGERTYVIGHPAGQPWSLTEGIISRPHRIRPGGQRMTQTSAQVFYGNSGGPLINNRGRAIGIASKLITPHMAFFTHVQSIKSFLNGR